MGAGPIQPKGEVLGMLLRHASAFVAVFIAVLSAPDRGSVLASMVLSPREGNQVQAPAAGVPQSVDALVAAVCESMTRAADEATLGDLLSDLAEVATFARGVNDEAIAARDALLAQYDAINARVDTLQAEREFISATTRERRGGLRSLVEQKLDTVQRLWTEGVGIEHRIARIERGLSQADQTLAGSAQGTLGWRGRSLPYRAFETIRNLIVGNRFAYDLRGATTGGVATDGRTGVELRAELRTVQSETVPAYAAKVAGVLGATPAPPIGRILGLLEREIADLKQQLASEIAADLAAASARLQAIDAELGTLESERRTILASSDDVMREGRRAAGEKAAWDVAAPRLVACADAARQRLRGAGSAPPGTGSGSVRWAEGLLSGAWQSVCTLDGKPLGQPAGSFALRFDGSGSITGSFVEGTTSSVTGAVASDGRLSGRGSYVMDGTRLVLSFSGTVWRTASGALGGKGEFTSNDGAGVACTGVWSGG